MFWAIYSQTFQDFFTFKFSETPYFLLVSGLLISLTCGLPLATILRQQVQIHATKFYYQTEDWWDKLQLFTSLLGTITGFSIMLASTLEILGSPTLPSYLLSLIITDATVSSILLPKNRKLERRTLNSY
jgi:hypothetical protein